MPRTGDIFEAAPAVGDFLVLGERVGDQREGPQIRLESLGQRLRRRLALLAVGVLQHVERELDGKRFSADLETKSGDGLVILTVPGRIAGDRLFVKKLLDAILKLIGLVLPHVLDPWPVMAERRIGHYRPWIEDV